MRTMINAMVDSLDQHDNGRNVIGSLFKMKDLAQVPLLRNGNKLFSRSLCSSPQFVEAGKRGEFLQSRGRGWSSKMPHLAFFGGEQVLEKLSHTTKRSYRGGIQLCVRQVSTCVEQAQVRPEVIGKKVGKSCSHCYHLLNNQGNIMVVSRTTIKEGEPGSCRKQLRANFFSKAIERRVLSHVPLDLFPSSPEGFLRTSVSLLVLDSPTPGHLRGNHE